MKKITLLLCMCLAAWCVPQRVWAVDFPASNSAGTLTINVSGTTLTIKSDAAGALSDFMNNEGDEGHVTTDQKTTMQACTKIVLKGSNDTGGKFNSDDLNKLAYDQGFRNVTEVDMSEAKFVKAADGGNNYLLFHDDASGSAAAGTKAIENIEGLYMWTAEIGWSNIPTPSLEEEDNVTLYASQNDMNNAVNSSLLNSYAAYPQGNKYCQINVTNESWSNMIMHDPGDAVEVGWKENSREDYKSNYYNGQTVKTKRYYKKIELASPNDVGWYLCYPNDLTGATVYEDNSLDITNLDASKYNLNDYVLFYVYYTKTNGTWSEMSMVDPGDASPAWFLENGMNGEIADGTYKIKRYYQKRQASYEWKLCTTDPTDAELASVNVYDGNRLGADMTNMFKSYAEVGSYLSFDVYYTKSDTRSWGTAVPHDGEVIEASFPFEYRDNHKNGCEINSSWTTFKNSDWVKMPEYQYCQLIPGGGDSNWQPVEFVDGEEKTLIAKVSSYENLPKTANNGDYAVVLGTEKVYDGTAWVASGSTVYDYDQMRFTNWKETLTHATTSKYANNTISDQLFSACKKLVHVSFLSGNVTGFNDHQYIAHYNTESDDSTTPATSLEVFIGKDVTQIDNDAFQRCDVLTSLTFDTNYEGYVYGPEGQGHNSGDPKPDFGYPKPLTIGDYAFQDCKNLMNVFIPNRVISIGNSAFEHAGNKTQTEASQPSTDSFVVTFERRRRNLDGSVSINYDHDLTIGNGCFNQCYKLKELSLPIRLSSLGSGAFTDTPNLESLTIREELKEDSRLKVIPSNAFLRSGIKSVKIPRSVLEIESGAFTECFNIETITFQETNDKVGDVQKPLIIRETAFAGGTESSYDLKQVNVNIHPETRLLVCEYNAFNFTSLVGQTDVTSKQVAVLQFPDDDWDYYQGNWKKGYAFSQSNLNLFKDGINRGTSEPTVNSEGLTVLDNEPRNGWQQFAMTSLKKEVVIPTGNFIRSYSTTTAHFIPKIIDTNAYLYKIYRVKNFIDGYSEGDDDTRENANAAERIAYATEVTNTIDERQYVPNNTGLIMVGQGDGSKYIIYQDEVKEGASITTYPYTNVTSADQLDENAANLLYPSCKTDESNVVPRNILDESKEHVVLYPTFPYPIQSTTADGNFRIFGFKGAERKFYRSKPGVLINRDMAYLMLPVSLFHWSNETGGTGSSGTGEDTSNITGSSRISLVFDDENDSETTGITMSSARLITNDAFYTLQGVKLSQPQGKGLYILNGKKVFVK